MFFKNQAHVVVSFHGMILGLLGSSSFLFLVTKRRSVTIFVHLSLFFDLGCMLAVL